MSIDDLIKKWQKEAIYKQKLYKNEEFTYTVRCEFRAEALQLRACIIDLKQLKESDKQTE